MKCMNYIQLGDVISAAKVERCGENDFPVLSITKSDGLVLQSEKFKKRIASKDTADYKVVHRGQLVQGIHIDEANFGVQEVADVGIVSPAYKIWDIKGDRIVPKYLETALRSPQSIAYYTSKFNGSVKRRERLTDKDFLQMNIPCPSITDQIYVIEVLNRATELVDHRKGQLQKLDELVKARFVEMFGNLNTNPKGWPVLPFPAFAAIDGNMTMDYEKYADYPHIGIDSIEKGTGELKGYRTVREDGVISGKYIFTPQHIIYSKIRPNLNKVALPSFEGLCSADAYPILPNSKNCNRVFLAVAMRSEYYLEYILQFSSRTNLPKVNRKEIAGFRMPLPPLPLQEQFAAFVEQVDKSKVAVQKALDEAQLLFDSLMQKYFG